MFFFWPIRDEFGVKRIPIINYAIIIINIAVFFFFGFQSSYQDIVNRYGFVPSRFSWLTVFTAMFLHGSFMHLAGNMWFLYLMGDNIEDRWGHFQYLLFYFMSGVIATLFYMILTSGKSLDIPSIGASGAISGVVGAYLVLFPKSKITFWYYIFLFFRIYSGTFDIFAWFWISLWFVQQIFGMIGSMSSTEIGGIAFAAHVGGFLTGLGIAFLTKIFQGVRYVRSVYSGQNALSLIAGENPLKIRSVDQQVELYNTEKEIENFLKNNDEREAAQLYGKTLKKYPEISIPNFYEYKFAEMLHSQGLLEEAIEAYKRFLRDNPFTRLTDNALYNLGKIYFEKGEKQKAKECFMHIVLFYPYSELHETAKYMLEKIVSEGVLVEK